MSKDETSFIIKNISRYTKDETPQDEVGVKTGKTDRYNT